MFHHFLVTRFNLRVDSWTKTRDGEATLNNEWLEDRFFLFEKYCLPSVLNQANKRFDWFVYFDISTPEIFFPRIEEISKNDERIHCIFINGIEDLENSFKSSIEKTLRTDCKWIITSRLDNDDILHNQFIQKIQDCFIPKHITVVDLREGFQLNIQTKKAEIRKANNPFNPFVSLIENSTDYKTVLSKLHSEWAYAESIVIGESMVLWIELIHKKNKLNDVSTNLPFEYTIDATEFGLEKDIFKKWPDYIIRIKNIKIKFMNYCDYQIGIAGLIVTKIKKRKFSYRS